MIDIKMEYQDENGKPVKSPRDPACMYTVINGMTRTVKNGVPQRLMDGKWVDLERPKT